MTARQQFDAVFQTYFTQRGIKNILTKLNTPDRLREAESAFNRSEAAILSWQPERRNARMYGFSPHL